ncbi:MAG: hypothetical protein ACLP1Q_04320, partial [Solirubrobacteraceae bacterium]
MGDRSPTADLGRDRSRLRGRLSWAGLLVLLALASVVPASASESSGAVAWGVNTDGQLGNDTTTTEKEAVAVKVLTEATAVAAGELHSLALLKSGKVMAWGANTDGQLGIGSTTKKKEPVEVKGLTEVVAVAAGGGHSLALLKSGKVMAWGDNADGQLGNGTTTKEKEPVEVKGLTEVVGIAAGADHSLAVLKNGKVMAWGDNADGQLGNGTTTTEKEPVEVTGLSEAAAVAGGELHSLALLKSGKVMAWGDNADGQLGNGTTTTEKEAVEVKGLSEAAAVAGGELHSLALLKSGKLMAWGDNADGQLGNGTTTTKEEPVEVTGLSHMGAIAAGANFGLSSYATLPANTEAPAISGEAKDEKTLSATTGTWSGSPPITYSYQWESCNTAGEACTSISGATSASYTVAHEEVGHTIRVKVTATNAAGEASASSAQTATVLPSAPANTAPPVVSGEAKDEKTLITTTGTWSGSPPITYSYQWESCNTAGEGCASISGATSSTYTIGHEEVGHTIRVKVTAKNSAGEAAATSSQTATVLPSAPVNTVLPVVSGEAKDEKTLSASTGTWAGSPTITYGYQWESCNTAGEGCAGISGATSATYAIGHEQVGHAIRVKVTATNAAGEASAVSTQTTTVAASAPANTALPVVSGEAKDERTLSASTGTWAGSPTITYGYQWESCNTSGEGCSGISGATSATYAIGHEEVGHTIRAKVTATNAAGEVPASSAQTTTVATSAPTNTVLPTISGSPKEAQTLTASAGSWDGTPPLSYEYQWLSCDSLGGSCFDISGATGTSHVLGASEVGGTLRVAVTASNPAGATSSTSEASSVIAESSCTDTWVGSAEGAWERGSNWSTGSVPGAGDIACVEAGTTVQVSGGAGEVEALKAAGASLEITGGSLGTTSTSKPSEVGTLRLSGGSLSVAGEFEVSGSLVVSGAPVVEGSGSVVVESGATGSI